MLPLQIDATQVILAVLGVALSVVGFLILRAVTRVDEGIKSLDAKVDALQAQDTKTIVDLTELRARVTVLEILVGVPKIPAARPPEKPFGIEGP